MPLPKRFDILLVNIIIFLMTLSTGIFALVDLLQIQDIFQASGPVVTDNSKCVRQ